ncbi:MAG: phycobilisome rod-core linker polypeptide [Cyanobacteria bacterium P01_F01_bin.150]
MLKSLKIKQKPKGTKKSSASNENAFVSFRKFVKSFIDNQTSPDIKIKTGPAEYIQVLADTDPVEFVADAVEQKDLVVSAAYKQVFGNVHLMESERPLAAESQLRSGDITVMEFVRQLAKSERYRTLVFEKNSNLRAVELNFKHLLGRSPENYAEVSEHIARLANEGFDSEIDSYLDSEEYFRAFGTDIVPYYRGYQTQSGRNLAGYTYSFQLMRGSSSSDPSTPTSSYANLDKRLLDSGSSSVTAFNMEISKKVEKLPDYIRTPRSAPRRNNPKSINYVDPTDPAEIIRKALNIEYPTPEIDNGSEPAYTQPQADPTDPAEIIRRALFLDSRASRTLKRRVEEKPQPITYRPQQPKSNDPTEVIKKALEREARPPQPIYDTKEDTPPPPEPADIIRKALKLD